jgi:hypothetical protein
MHGLFFSERNLYTTLWNANKNRCPNILQGFATNDHTISNLTNTRESTSGISQCTPVIG